MQPTQLPDERLGRPSASKFHIDANCPGRWQLLESIFPEISPAMFEADEGAERGTRIHKARELNNTFELKDEGELAAYKRGLTLENDSVIKWAEDCKLPSLVVEGERELRLWLYDEQGNPLLSGKADVHYHSQDKRHVFVQDWKSGSCSGLDPADVNWQMKVCAVLLAKYYQAEHVRVSLNKMEVGSGVVDEFDYDAQGLAVAEWEILRVIDGMKRPNAPRYAGRWCNYCPCRGGLCPEAGAYAMMPMVVAGIAAETTKERTRELVSRLSPQQMQYLYSRRNVIKQIMDAVADSLKSQSPAELAKAGYKLTAGKRTRTVRNEATEAAISKLAISLRMTDEEAWKCLSIDLGACEDIARNTFGVSESRAKEMVETLLGDMLEVKIGEGILREL